MPTRERRLREEAARKAAASSSWRDDAPGQLRTFATALIQVVRKWWPAWLVAWAIYWILDRLAGPTVHADFWTDVGHVTLAPGFGMARATAALVALSTVLARYVWLDEIADDWKHLKPNERVMAAAVVSGLIFLGYAHVMSAVLSYMDH